MADPARGGLLIGHSLLLRRARLGGAVVDVRVQGGRVADIGPVLEAGALEVVDLDGRELWRGFWDEHVHVTQAALAARRIPLGGAASAAEVLGRVRAAADEAVGDEPLIGFGFQDGLWPDRPALAALDAASSGRLTVLISHDVHAVWLNTVAAHRFRADPGPGGMLREGPAFAVGVAANELEAARTAEAVEALMHATSRRGVVGLVDFEMAENREVWLERMARGWSGPRVEAARYPPHLDDAIALGVRSGDAVPGTNGLLVEGPLKVLIDGALNTRTAYCVDPYPDGTRGLLTVPVDDLRGLLVRGSSAGLTLAVHAIGDAAATAALDAFDAVGVRGRIEHAQLVAETDVPRFAALGVTASVQPAHLLDDREVAAEHWAGRTQRAYPFRALLDAGATLALGSDAPVARLDPWLALRAAVHRARPGETAWHPEQRIPLDAALAASTRGRAEPRIGDAADLIALDSPIDRLDGAVAMTLVGGRVAHSSL